LGSEFRDRKIERVKGSFPTEGDTVLRERGAAATGPNQQPPPPPTNQKKKKTTKKNLCGVYVGKKCTTGTGNEGQTTEKRD